MKLFWLKHKLSGVAQTFMETQDEEVKNNYDRLIDVLSAYFKDTTSITMRYKEAFNCTQSQSESVVEFKEKVSENFRKAEKLTPLTADLARKHVFLLGLQDDYKADLVSKCDDNMTFDQVANLTVDLEKQRADIANLTTHSAHYTQNTPMAQNTPMTTHNHRQQQTLSHHYRPQEASRFQASNSLVANCQRFCFYCSGNHPAVRCTTFPSLEERKKLTREKKLCFNCLRPNHMLTDCKNPKSCQHCNQRHHSSLCPRNTPVKTPVLQVSSMQQSPKLSLYEQPKKPEMIAETTESERNNAKSTAVLLTPNEASLYQTAVAQISSAEPNQRYPKKEVTARMLFDTGSSHSFITEKAANKLFLKRQQGDPLTISSFGSDSTQQVSNSCVTFNVELSGGGVKSITANVVPKITSPIAREPLNFDTYPELKMVSLADH
ncbi:MAG: hypothetical protein GY820_06070, partial [Gammaproteobacteria bacterium]|nr:hypothetical protein [Gammaproteobacteria bacterium]